MLPTTSRRFARGKSGLGLTLGRVTLNSADYSFRSFNYDNVTDDFALEHFDHTLAYDRKRVMPMIRRAKKVAVESWQDPIRLFASPWSPPGWMKTNDNMINSDAVCLRNDTVEGSYKQTWANYITMWLDACECTAPHSSVDSPRFTNCAVLCGNCCTQTKLPVCRCGA